jgi:hypothetical protein
MGVRPTECRAVLSYKRCDDQRELLLESGLKSQLTKQPPLIGLDAGSL